MYQNLGFVAVQEGDTERAAALLSRGVHLALKINSTSQFVVTLMALAGLYAAQHQAEKGARLMGAGEAMLEQGGLVLQPADQIEILKYHASLRRELGEAAYAAALQEGRRLSLEEATALAME